MKQIPKNHSPFSKGYCRFFIFLIFTIITSLTKAQPLHWDGSLRWISPSYIEDTLQRPCPVFRKAFQVQKGIRSATLLVTARGLYEASINGKRVGNALFTPGWTAYHRRLQYQRYDVTGLLRKGSNDIQATIGEGWFRGAFGGLMARNNYGREAGLLLQLDLVFLDGSTSHIVSDASWSCTTGFIRHSDIYGGELQDLRVALKNWTAVTVSDVDHSILVETVSPTVKQNEKFRPIKMQVTKTGKKIIDFGQNLAGLVTFQASGHAGDTITIEHAEMLDSKGELFRDNLREAIARDTYVLGGDGWVTVYPHFTWHGFRYICVSASAKDVRTKGFNAIAIYSDMDPTGTFTCSDEDINKLQHNISWSMKSNFLDIPTDCPQRSERLGWTGDAHVFFSTAAFNMDVDRFFRKWLADLSAEQRADGSVPNIIPNIYYKLIPKRRATAGWGDAAVIIPWLHFKTYGDTAILSGQYECMKNWVGHIASTSKDWLWKADGYGDWLAPGDSTSILLINQCFWAHSADILAKTALVLGRDEDAKVYGDMFAQVKNALIQNYFSSVGQAVTHTQTAYILPLAFGLLPPDLHSKAVENLVSLIRNNGNHLATGFLGTPYLLQVLSDNGHDELAYTLLMQSTCPSWLYPIKKGATTIWEKWDAVKPDDSLQVTSFNHYAYGAVGDWLYRYMGGISSIDVARREVVFRPHVGLGISWASAVYQSAFGKIVCKWKKKGSHYTVSGSVPIGGKAILWLPDGSKRAIGSGKFRYQTYNK